VAGAGEMIVRRTFPVLSESNSDFRGSSKSVLEPRRDDKFNISTEDIDSVEQCLLLHRFFHGTS
jgi:hypothetical protein